MTGDALRAAALDYAARGLHVFPVWMIRHGRCACELACGRDAGKHPIGKLVPNGFKSASVDAQQIRAWWQDYPDASIGIATGAASGVWALDVDAVHGGDDTLADLERRHGELAGTATALTGGGGRHLLWRYGAPVPTRVGVAPGIDVRGDGGYIVAPPSLHMSGRRYTWAIGYGPGEVPLASAPPWLLSLVTAPAPGGRRLRADGAALHIAAGTRNDTLMRLAAALRRYGIGEVALRECLSAINRHHAHPPLDEPEVVEIAASVARYAPATGAPRTVRVQVGR